MTESQLLVGGAGDDIIYGGDDRGFGKYYGDYGSSADGFDPLIGGNDIIYGGGCITLGRIYVGGGYDDRLVIGYDGTSDI